MGETQVAFSIKSVIERKQKFMRLSSVLATAFVGKKAGKQSWSYPRGRLA